MIKHYVLRTRIIQAQGTPAIPPEIHVERSLFTGVMISSQQSQASQTCSELIQTSYFPSTTMYQLRYRFLKQATKCLFQSHVPVQVSSIRPILTTQ